MKNKKLDKLREAIEEIEVEDLVLGEALVYISDGHVDFLSHLETGEDIDLIIKSLTAVSVDLLMSFIEDVPSEESIVDLVEYFSSMFKTLSFRRISQEKELFDRYLLESARILGDESDDYEYLEEPDSKKVLH